MQTKIVVIGAVLVAAAFVGVVALRGSNSDRPSAEADQQPGSAPGAQSAPAPIRRVEAPKPPLTPSQIEGAVRLPATESYENTANLKVLADTLAPSLERGDADAARTMARILGECSQIMLFPGYAPSFRSNLSDLSAEQRAVALSHIDRLEQRCADIAKTEKLTTNQLRDLERRGTGVDDIVALAQRVAADPASLSPPERADAVRRIIASRNGEAIFVLADAMTFSDDTENFLLRKHAGQPTDVYAWKLVGCAFGAPCGPDSSVVRQNCIVLRQCMAGGYREYVRYYMVSPYNYEVVSRAEQEILSIISSGRAEEILY